MPRARFWCGCAAGAGLLLIGSAIALDRFFPPDLARLASAGTEIDDRDGRVVALLPAPGGVWRFRASGTDVAPGFADLLVAVEDRRFWWHPGVDPVALARAAWQWARTGRIVSGGSTLTMQVARLLEPRPRTMRSKLIEIARALQLEVHYSRRDILGMWLTLAPFGGNLEGVRAASFAWFGVPPSALDPAQAALLVAIPRRPEALRPDRHPAHARLVRDRVLRVGGAAGLFAAEDMLGEPVPAHRIAMPRHAPQVVAALPRVPHAATLLPASPIATLLPASPIATLLPASPIATLLPASPIATTLDLPLQAALERLAAQRLQSLPPSVSVALLIGDLRTREIRAVTAGAWRDQNRAGALDLTNAVRSPGSALKPFLYALAFQDGIASPKTVLSDLPTHFGGYAPEDYDRAFAGSVTAADALRWSLNVPAVALLREIGPPAYAAALRAAGVRLRLPDGAAPSLPLALGGAGITLRQVASLYAALATDGVVVPLKLRPADPAPRRTFVQAAAARMVADVLVQPFPDRGPPGVGWKTGTSWGGRDAWAIGFDAAHVVCVWVGRPDGTAMPGATGRRLALPLLARVFDLLPPAPRHAAPVRLPDSRRAPDADRPRLLFPPPGAVLTQDSVVIRVMGGRRPLAFLVDGARLPSAAVQRQAEWSPAGPGFYRLTVIDADGAAASAPVRVR